MKKGPEAVPPGRIGVIGALIDGRSQRATAAIIADARGGLAVYGQTRLL
jgi:hypothetical protein